MNILIIGYGSIAKKHIEAFSKVDKSINFIALRYSRSSAEIPDIKSLYSLDDIAKHDINGVIISNPTAYHGDAIESVADLGVPLMIEKPVLASLENVEHYRKIIKENQIKTYVACNLRFLNAAVFMKQYLANQTSRLNEVNAYCGSYLPDWRPGVNFRKVYSANKEMGGGVHLDLIHEIDMAFWFFGKPTHTHRTLRSTSSLNISSFDYAHYILTYQDFIASITLNYFRRDSKRTIEFVFETKTLSLDILKNTVKDSSTKKKIFSSLQKPIDTYFEQAKYFCELIKENSESFNSFEDGINVLKICIDD